MSGRTRDDSPAELVVQVAAGSGEPNYMLVLGRPVNGRVRVREWSDDSWSDEAHERMLGIEDVWGRVEQAFRQRRRVTVEMAQLRAWLDGRPI